MAELPLYQDDPYRRQVQTEVLASGEADGRPWVVLADALFHPEGGGQPADRGTVNGVKVVDVRKAEGAVRIVLGSPVAQGPIEAVLDWDFRFDFMQQHSAQHLLTATALREFNWFTRGVHLGSEYSAIELNQENLPPDQLEQLEQLVNASIREARSMRNRLVEQADMESLGVRSRRLPEGFHGPVRVVEIEGIDRNTCGGTHLSSTADLQVIHLLGTEPLRGGTRLKFLAGGRVLKRLRQMLRLEADLKDRLDGGLDRVVETIDQRLQELRELRRQLNRLEGELAGAVAADLRQTVDARRHLPGRSMAFLQEVANAVLDGRPEASVVLTGGDDGEIVLLVMGGEASSVDAAAVGRRLAERLGGRGGGPQGRFQGKAAASGREAEMALAELDGGSAGDDA